MKKEKKKSNFDGTRENLKTKNPKIHKKEKNIKQSIYSEIDEFDDLNIDFDKDIIDDNIYSNDDLIDNY